MEENFVYTSILEAKILSVGTNHDFIEHVFDIHSEEIHHENEHQLSRKHRNIWQPK